MGDHMFETHYATLIGLAAGVFYAQDKQQYLEAVGYFQSRGAGYGVEWKKKEVEL